MNHIQLIDLIRAETRTAITEAISAQEKKELQELGARLKTWADREYQKQMKDVENDREWRDLAEKDYANYIKIADALKNGDGEKAWALAERLDTAAQDAVPSPIWDALADIDHRVMSEHDLADQLMFFKSELKSFDQLIKDRKWADALERWKNLIRVEADNVKDALGELV